MRSMKTNSSSALATSWACIVEQGWISLVLQPPNFSMLAPIRMVFHSRFVLTNLLGRTVTWRSAGRRDDGTTWGEALRHHGLDSLLATAWGASCASRCAGGARATRGSDRQVTACRRDQRMVWLM